MPPQIQASTVFANSGKAQNTLPLDINAAMTQRVQPTIFALGTASTLFSLAMIALFIVIYTILYRRSR